VAKQYRVLHMILAGFVAPASLNCLTVTALAHKSARGVLNHANCDGFDAFAASVRHLVGTMANNSSSRGNREWFAPQGEPAAVLKLYNSLVDDKVPFIPATGAGSRQINWYACGPTVYDSAHMGHARNYVTFDVIRRVLEDYFGYNILYVMNVTDVDDKIIMRARRNYLLQQYQQEQQDLQQVRVVRLYRHQDAGAAEQPA
jgi:hypothetical protein